ncbi:hypothetical protein [Parasaccharibacter sp. TMW 2.1884]|uniref:hypothetical protein n=1 Tax=Parasaccharibacter sp. TMW 2.1884 TaxID=2267834 RepID=UPI002011E840|nr:hypothetical protein [Parasaccharibacter sp. TMW 2.1884]
MQERNTVLYLAGAALLAAFVAALLGGCTPALVRLTCPPLVQYSAQEQAALAAELRSHPDLKEVPVFLTDYGNERAECRALGAKKAGG